LGLLIILLNKLDRKLLEIILALLNIRVLNIKNSARFKKSPTFSGGPFIFFRNLNLLKRLGFKV